VASQLDEHVGEVHLGLGAWLFGLRHEPGHPGRLRPLPPGDDLRPPPVHVLAHRRIRHPRVMLIDQPLEDPLGGMPLLPRRGQVLAQHLIDPPGHRLAHRRGPHRDLTLRRQRRGNRLPHRAAVHVILARQRPDRHPVALPVEADSREQLHPLRPHPGPTQGTNPHRHHQRSAWLGQLSRISPACRPRPQSGGAKSNVLSPANRPCLTESGPFSARSQLIRPAWPRRR
jgi:hypothetical protein